jgi:hypothetical protein
MTDCRATPATGISGTSVNPEAILRAGAVRGTALLAAVGDDCVPGILEHVGRYEALRGVDERLNLLGRNCRNKAERINPLDEADLGFEDVTDSGQDVLMKKDVPDFLAVASADPSGCGSRIEVFVEHV